MKRYTKENINTYREIPQSNTEKTGLDADGFHGFVVTDGKDIIQRSKNVVAICDG